MERILVIIPFYKLEFFNQTLNALAEQTDKSFVLFVGNDASSLEAELLSKSYSEKIEIFYHRFDKRLGDSDVAAQWSRCVEFFVDNFSVCDPEWIWFIPDDDLPSRDCVEDIKRAIIAADRLEANVVHIPCVKIDGEGKLKTQREEWPPIMNSGLFYLQQLKGIRTGLTLGNAVMRYSSFKKVGGFVSLPRAWGSDHATFLSVAAGGPIVTASCATLYFRMSGLNISSDLADVSEKLKARLMFAQFLKKHGQLWYQSELACEILLWFYNKTEYYFLGDWGQIPLSQKMLFEIAKTCDVPRSWLQKLSIRTITCLKQIKRNMGFQR